MQYMLTRGETGNRGTYTCIWHVICAISTAQSIRSAHTTTCGKQHTHDVTAMNIYMPYTAILVAHARRHGYEYYTAIYGNSFSQTSRLYTSEIETLDELESSRVRYMLNDPGRLLILDCRCAII